MKCPKCKTGKLRETKRSWKCSDNGTDCKFFIPKRICEVNVTKDIVSQLVSQGESKVIRNFRSRKGRRFDARLYLNKNFEINFRLPEGSVIRNTDILCPACKNHQLQSFHYFLFCPDDECGFGTWQNFDEVNVPGGNTGYVEEPPHSYDWKISVNQSIVTYSLRNLISFKL